MKNRIILTCSQCLSRNYTTRKRKTSNQRLMVKKFCKKCNTHTVHKETK